MSKIKAALELIKETPKTFVYGDKSIGSVIPSLYLPKAAVPSPTPKTATVTVEFDNE